MGTGEPSERWYGQQAVYRVSMGNFVSSPRCPWEPAASCVHAVLLCIAAVIASMQSDGGYALRDDNCISSPLLAAQHDIQPPAQPSLELVALTEMGMATSCPKRCQALCHTSWSSPSWQQERSSSALV